MGRSLFSRIIPWSLKLKEKQVSLHRRWIDALGKLLPHRHHFGRLAYAPECWAAKFCWVHAVNTPCILGSPCQTRILRLRCLERTSELIMSDRAPALTQHMRLGC